jgi:hypothetical protein
MPDTTPSKLSERPPCATGYWVKSVSEATGMVVSYLVHGVGKDGAIRRSENKTQPQPGLLVEFRKGNNPTETRAGTQQIYVRNNNPTTLVDGGVMKGRGSCSYSSGDFLIGNKPPGLPFGSVNHLPISPTLLSTFHYPIHARASRSDTENARI